MSRQGFDQQAVSYIIVHTQSSKCMKSHHARVTLTMTPSTRQTRPSSAESYLSYSSAIFFAPSLAFGQLVRFLART